MSSHITIVPASSRSGAEAIRLLLKSESKPFVRGIYRNPSKAPAEFTANPNFQAVKGEVATGEGLDFSNSTAVLYVPPPPHDGTDTGKFATESATNVESALKKAGTVKRLILHSAFGAHHDHSIGVMRLNNITDKILKSAAPEVLILKPGYYYENWAYTLQQMQAEPPSFDIPFSPTDHKIPMLSVKDVGEFCAKALLDEEVTPGVREVDMVGPRDISALDIKQTVEEITGKQAKMNVIEKEDIAKWFTHEIPEVYAQEYADMIIALLPGGIIAEDYDSGRNTFKAKIELIDALKETYSP